MTLVIAHVGGFPVEEALGSFGPLLLAGMGAGLATVRARVRRWQNGRH